METDDMDMKKSRGADIAEKKFLAEYDASAYNSTSVATDIVVLSLAEREIDCHRRDSEYVFQILLIKRGEHPYKDMWALPGGFLRNDETVEECALRELMEETKLVPVSIMPIGVFSDPQRDPRCRIVSNAFVSVIGDNNVAVEAGGDASSAKWFDVKFDKDENGIFSLLLRCDEEEVNLRLKEKELPFKQKDFEVISNDALAFDHGKIIVKAFNELRKRADNIEVAFEFLPEKFTLSSLQRVQEILVGETFLTANFRRKIAGYVEELDEYTSGAGHRPAKLFRRKQY